MASKAPRDGVYTMTDAAGRVHRFKVRSGDLLPDGAEMAADEDAPAAKKASGEKPAAKKATGPSETTATAPSETA